MNGGSNNGGSSNGGSNNGGSNNGGSNNGGSNNAGACPRSRVPPCRSWGTSFPPNFSLDSGLIISNDGVKATAQAGHAVPVLPAPSTDVVSNHVLEGLIFYHRSTAASVQAVK